MHSDDSLIRIRYSYQNDISFEFTTKHLLKLIDFERSSTLKEGRRSFSSSSSSSSSSSPSRYRINFNQISFYCLQILQCTHLASNSIILPFLNANSLEKICNYFQEFRVSYQRANVTLLSNGNLPVHIDISNLFALKKTTLPIDEMGVFLIDSKPIETDAFITNIGCTLFVINASVSIGLESIKNTPISSIGKVVFFNANKFEISMWTGRLLLGSKVTLAH